MLLVDAFTGMRVSELLALKWSDVDLERGLLSIRRSYYRRQLRTSKNRSSERTVPLSPGLVSAMRCHKLRRPESALDLVFPNAVGQPYDAGNLLKRILYSAFAALGLLKPRWRVFRRSVAAALSEVREPVRTTQQALGHSSPQATLAFYVQSGEESQREAIGRLEEPMFPNLGGSSS
jgi:integrase